MPFYPLRAISLFFSARARAVCGMLALGLSAAFAAEVPSTASAAATTTVSTTPKPKNNDRKQAKKGERKEARTQQAQKDAEAAEAKAKAEEPANPFESGKPFTVVNPIDQYVLDDLKAQGLKPMPQCSDAVFLRRVYLDATGTIPKVGQAKAFLQSKDPNKRAALVKQLVESPEFATYWTLKWGDLLRIKAEFPINLWPNAAQAYSHYVLTSVRENMPVDQFATELLTASGSNFRDPPANFFRAMQGRDKKNIAASVALVFLGERPDKMPPERIEQLAVFFSRVKYKTSNEWKEEIVYTDPVATDALPVVYPDGTKAVIPEGQDPRAAFAAWLVKPENPFFARTQVNRMWYWVFGIPLYDSVDNLTPASRPTNPQLTAYLAKYFADSGYDTRALLSQIFNSSTYQQSSLLNADKAQLLKHFGVYPIRQLEAEPLIDAICKVTGTTEIYVSTTPEPYTTLPTCEDAVSIPDGSITTAFLDLFSRSPRDTGLSDERDPNPSAAQRVHMLNASHIRRKIDQGDFPRMPKQGDLKSFVDDIFLRTLSRYPTSGEIAVLRERSSQDPNRFKYKPADIYWALINSDEFINRH